MNRTVEFRAWRKNKIVGPFTLEDMLNVAAEMGFHLDAPSPVVWMQCTGLKDKNGLDIFEGDIISTPTATGYKNWEVKYEGCAFYLSAVNSYASLSYYSKLSKIIGNIHENQELMGGKE